MAVFGILMTTVSSYQFWILALVTYFLFRKLTAKRYNLPPRPYSWPLIGNAYYVFRGKPILYEWCQKVAKDVGPIFRISLGPVDVVVLNDLDTTRKAMQQKELDGRIKSCVLETLSFGYSDVSLGNAEQPTFNARRKLLTIAIRNFTVGKAFEERVSETLSKVFKLFEPLADKMEAFDPSECCKLLTYNMTASICFQKGGDLDDPEFKEIAAVYREASDTFTKPVTISDFIPFVKCLPFELSDIKGARILRGKLMNILHKEMKLSRERMEKSDDIGDLTSYVLKTRDEGRKEGLDQVTELEMTLIISDVFGGGVDTTHISVLWILLYLAAYPDVQEKVYQEIIDNVYEEDEIVSAIEYKAKMPYSQAVVLEMVRFATIAPLGLAHTALCDTKIGDYDIPKDTMIIVNQWAINHCEEDLPEPDKFIPERFLDKDGNLGPRPRGYMPFGTGRRVCPGESFAKTAVWIMYVSLLKRFQILPPEGLKLKVDAGDNAFNRAPKPFQIVLKRRERSKTNEE